VNPFDLVGMADAFHTALTMSPAEKHSALQAQRQTIGGNTIFRWVHDQIADLVASPQPLRRPGIVSMFPASEETACWEVLG
jgi:trehalose-6-phosphate synthase